ncbi:MAG: glutaminyl-peptide cyclotransferase [Bacteroidales bacterium]|nr:glutaminyl-peptide cyclotransferase [Bacteroidales bacterium]
MVSTGNFRVSSLIKAVSAAILLSVFIFQSCSDDKEKSSSGTKKPVDTVQKPIKKEIRMSFDYPASNILIAHGEIVPIEASPKELNVKPDSAVLFINGKRVVSSLDFPLLHNWNTKENKLGRHSIKLKSYFSGEEEEISTSVQIKSEIEPIMYSYKIVKKYPHDTKAYSQGLFYEDGFLYEGTGQYGESTIRKVSLEDGKIQDYFNMPPNIFGEGITIIGDNIYQLSWRENKGFVYNKNSFELIKNFEFSTEGWGLTSDGKKLYMTDGSNKLFVLDKDNFNVIETIEVYNNNGPITNLNELEYINGEIYANVYLTDFIVIINPETGKITGQIDLTGLLKTTNYTGNVDVLNGIAWDSKTKRLFITGKLWPNVFEISLVRK